jgi:hypothetical protein
MRHGLFACAVSLDELPAPAYSRLVEQCGNQPPMTPAITAVIAAKKIPSTLLTIADELIE